MNISIKCSDGFVNQLRLSLAANYLMAIGEVRTAEQEWILNNHNIVDYDKFFNRLKYLSFNKIDDENAIKTTSFYHLVSKYGDPKSILKKSFSYLMLLGNPNRIINEFIKKNNIKNCIGVHLRTGCKTALLEKSKDRHQPLSQDFIINSLKSSNKKIYLATDNQETQDKFIDIFKNRIIFFQKLNSGKENFEGEYDRSKVERNGTDMHVVADFFILQSCKYFIGSNESSFSIMINWLRDNKNDHEVKGII